MDGVIRSIQVNLIKTTTNFLDGWVDIPVYEEDAMTNNQRAATTTKDGAGTEGREGKRKQRSGKQTDE